MNEFMQPVRPLRIVHRLSDGQYVTLQVFAVCVKDSEVNYLTIDGVFYERKTISFAETFIDGEWMSVK
jgi:hypothetical protein